MHASPGIDPGPRVRIGCAGWSIATSHQPLFGQGESMLARYATRFDCVEINSSFHRPHQRATYARWAAAVPGDFRFSAKLPRQISHEARLYRAGPLLDAFLQQAGGLGHRLSTLLLQLPPSLDFDARVAANFLAVLRRRWDLGVVCEPRHASWFGEAAEALLLRHDIARVGADPARQAEGAVPGGAPSRRYWRWHGSPRIYYSAYAEPALDALAAQVGALAPEAGEAWVIFDNTAHGHATTDALRLAARLAGTQPGPGAAGEPLPGSGAKNPRP